VGGGASGCGEGSEELFMEIELRAGGSRGG
jgi:hypothetical protein